MIADFLVGLGVAVTLAGVLMWAWPALRRAARGQAVRWLLLTSRDGRHALVLAQQASRSARRIRRSLAAMQQDSAQRLAVRGLLDRFTGEELDALLWQMRLLLATGANDRVRALHMQIEADTRRWAAAPDGLQRQRLVESIGLAKQQLEANRRTTQEWVRLVRGLQAATEGVQTLERELVTLEVTRHQPLAAFQQRLADSLDDLKRVREAHRELNQRA